MKITLKSFHYAAFASEETNCFEAIVCIDGKPAFQARNDGHGGCDFYDPLKGQSREDFDREIKRVEDYAKTLPAMKYHGTALEYDVELLVGEAVNDEIASRDLKRKLGKKTLFTATDKKGLFVCPTAWTDMKRYFANSVPGDGDNRSKFFKRNSVDKILNELSFDEALKLYIANAH